MTEPMTLQSHAKRLRKAAEEIRDEGHAGWGNTCEIAADAIDAAIKARDAAVPVGTATQGYGAASNRTFANFLIDKVPEGTKLYTTPPAQPVRVPDPTILYTVEEVTEAQEVLRKHGHALMDEVIDQMIDVLLAAISPQEKDHE